MNRLSFVGLASSALAFLALATSSASAQCTTGFSELHLSPFGTPGMPVTFTVKGEPFAPYVIGAGQKLNWGATPPCIDVSDQTFFVFVNGLVLPFFRLDAAGESTFSVQVPSDPSFMFETYFFQAVTFESSGQLDFSNTMGLTIGLNGFSCDADTLEVYRFDEGLGPVSMSTCGGEVAAVPSNVTWAAGALGSGLLFDGNSEVVFADPLSNTTKTPGPFTVEALIHLDPADLPGPGGIYEIIRKNLGFCQDVFELRIGRSDSGGPATMSFGYLLQGRCPQWGGPHVGGYIESMVTQVGWYHIVGQYDGVDELKALFGPLGQPLQVVGTSYWGRIDPIEDFSDVHIGLGVGPPAASGIRGCIDEVRVSKVARY